MVGSAFGARCLETRKSNGDTFPPPRVKCEGVAAHSKEQEEKEAIYRHMEGLSP